MNSREDVLPAPSDVWPEIHLVLDQHRLNQPREVRAQLVAARERLDLATDVLIEGVVRLHGGQVDHLDRDEPPTVVALQIARTKDAAVRAFADELEEFIKISQGV